MFHIKLINPTQYMRNLEEINIPSRCIVETGSNGSKIYRSVPQSIIHTDDGKMEIYPFGFQYVANRFNQHYFYRLYLNRKHAVFIDAQTGTGKTYMTFNNLYPLLKKLGLRLLILASRTLLKDQVKHDAIRAAIPEREGDWTPQGISHQHTFGDIDVYSYQDFINPEHCKEIQTNLSSNIYGAVVFDECHYFISDADFNPYTEKQFRFLIKTAIRSNVLRLYLTATPDYVFDKIYEIEDSRAIALAEPYCFLTENLRNQSPFRFRHYYFHRDYSYLCVRFFPPDKFPKIVSRESGNKVLVFSESKEKATEQIELLKKQGVTSSFLLDSDSRKGDTDEANKVKEALLSNDIGVDVLFATKCLDAGVTINTKDLAIICWFKDKVDFIQAIGRKRLVSDNEKVYLYIPIYTEKDMSEYLGQLKYSKAIFEQKQKDYPDGKKMNGNTELPHPIYVEQGKYRHNAFAVEKLNHQINEVTSLIEAITTSDEAPEITIARHILSWINLENTFSTDLMIGFSNPNSSDTTERDAILTIIQEYERMKINSDTFKCLQEKLKPYDRRKDQRTDRKDLSTQAINNIFKNAQLPYSISGRKDKATGQLKYTLNRKEVQND